MTNAPGLSMLRDMNVEGQHFRTIWVEPADPKTVRVIDQRHLPHQFVIETLTTVEETATAIRDMHVRGAGLIGAAAGYGMYLAARTTAQLPGDEYGHAMRRAGELLMSTRPTAVNLQWAVQRQLDALNGVRDATQRIATARATAAAIAEEDADACRRIGELGLPLLEAIHTAKHGETVNILTHCNAGWLAFVDYGSATAPIYAAADKGIPVHVWVDETRPRNQGARLTAWELGQHGIPHTVIADNVGGHLMQHGMVDLMLTGTDRTTRRGDVANKIGTYLKALAAQDNGIPFYVALPSSTFDWTIRDGIHSIPIEQRNASEVRCIRGACGDQIIEVLLTPASSPAANYAFDVTPAELVTGLITERGVCQANEAAILQLFPEFTAVPVVG